MSVAQIFGKTGKIQRIGKASVRLATRNRPDSMLFANSSEYMEGEAAFRCGLTIRNNPYPFLSPEYWRWQEGLLGNGHPRECLVSPKLGITTSR